MHVKPLVEHVRFYLEDSSYKDKDPYDAIITVVWLDDKTVSLQGLKGNFNKERRTRLIAYYKSRGITDVMYTRNGKDVVLRT